MNHLVRERVFSSPQRHFRVTVKQWLHSSAVALVLQLAWTTSTGWAAEQQALPVPAKSSWVATASGSQNDRNGPELAIDGDHATRWSSPFDDGHWIQFDLMQPSTVVGARLFWETAFAGKYRVLSSEDGKTWQTCYETVAGDGLIDHLYFSPTTSRYWRIVCDQQATDRGASLWEFDLFGPNMQPVITTSLESDSLESETAALMDGDLKTYWQETKGQGTNEPQQIINIDLHAHFDMTGIRVDWGDVYSQNMRLESSSNSDDWRPLTEVTGGNGKVNFLVSDQRWARYFRLTLSEPSDRAKPMVIREFSIRSPGEPVGPTMLYQGIANKQPAGYYPDQARSRQTYWTIVGLPSDTEESLFDEYGSIEAQNKSPMLMPFLRTAAGQFITAADVDCEQKLAENWLPLPTVVWHSEPIKLTIEAIPGGKPGASANFVRYRVTNVSDRRQQGKFFLAIRPHQINPRWQHGGIAPLPNIRVTRLGDRHRAFSTDDQNSYVLLGEPSGFGAAPFDSNEGDIVRFLAEGVLPEEDSAKDSDGLASAAFAFDYDLEPEASQSVVVAAPLHNNADQVATILQADGKPLTDPSAAFDRLRANQLAEWRRRLDKVTIQVGDAEVTDTLRAQAGYILINQDGDAIQPGSRNYNRSWIRDGSLTATALMRLGLFEETRKYIEWYAQRVPDSGLVPPIVHNDGSRYSGYGEIEYDAQGEFVFMVVNYYRLTGDEAFLRQHFDQLVRVMRQTAQLCDQTRQPDHMADEPARERFHGLLPPSISHEGYSTPVHSYWDDYWALKGWLDLRDVAIELGRGEIAEWAESEYEELVEAVRKTIDATVAFKQIDFLPSSSDYGDPDPTSISIGIYPCGQLGNMRPDLLRSTYDKCFAEVVKRTKSGAKYGYTPYEIRNLMSFALLDQPERAETLLDFLMLGRRPTGWRHFAEVVLSDERQGSYIGDMPHTWVGSGFVNTILGMLFFEEEMEIRILVAAPKKWLLGDGVKLRDVPTHFGRLDFDAKLADDTMQVNIGGKLQGLSRIHLGWPWAGRPRSVTVDGQTVPDFEDGGINLSPTARHVSVQWPK